MAIVNDEDGFTQLTKLNVLKKLLLDGVEITASNGDVVGPASSVTGNVPSYADATGKLIDDSGVVAADIIQTGTDALLTSLTISDSPAELIMKNTSAPVDEGVWVVKVGSGGAFKFETLTDALGAGDEAIGINRNLTTVENIEIFAPLLVEALQLGSASFTTTTDTATLGFRFLYRCTNTAAPRTLTISSADIALGTNDNPWYFEVSDQSGGAGTNNITIDTEGSETIDGVSSVSITANFGAVTIYSNGTNLFTVKSESLPGGSDTQVQFNNNNVLDGDSNFIWDNVNKRAGIGAASPQAPLEVQTSDVTTEAVIFTATSQNGRTLSILQPDIADPDTPFVFQTNNAMTFRIDALDALIIDDAGNTAVTGLTANNIVITTSADGATLLNLNTDRRWEFQQEGTGSSTALRLRNTLGINKNFFIDTDGSTQWRSVDGTTTLMKIDQGSGDLSLGTTSANQKLHVVAGGTSTATSLADRGILVTNNIAAGLTLEDTGAGVDKKVMRMVYADENWSWSSLNDVGDTVDVADILVINRDGIIEVDSAILMRAANTSAIMSDTQTLGFRKYYSYTGSAATVDWTINTIDINKADVSHVWETTWKDKAGVASVANPINIIVESGFIDFAGTTQISITTAGGKVSLFCDGTNHYTR